MHKVVLHGKAPELFRLEKLECDPKDVRIIILIILLQFNYDVDINYRGIFELLIKTQVTLTLTENNQYKIPFTCNILIKSINGRIRLFFSNDKPCWFGFLGKPSIKFNIDPVLGKNSQFEIKNFPKLRSFLEDLIEKTFDEFSLPNIKPLNLPVTI